MAKKANGKANVSPDRGGNTMWADKQRGGKGYARTFGQDLMRGEHKLGDGNRGGKADAIPGGAGKGSVFTDTNKFQRQRKADQRKGDVNLPAGLVFGAMHMNDEADRTLNGTSIFDPVLCELAYRWFCPPGGRVLDPFAGGSVRGIVAGRLGREYFGIDLRAEQIAANREQAKAIKPKPLPVWALGDARDLAKICKGMAFDFLFSCPPYFDLERYSDDPRDLSCATWPEFSAAYSAIIAAALALLKPDRFACFVVGDIRDQAGFYRGLPALTGQAFAAAGAALYNDAILVTAAGSLPVRVGKQFEASRKLGKTHQNVLIFCKGDPRKATQAIGEVEFGVLDQLPASDSAGAGIQELQ